MAFPSVYTYMLEEMKRHPFDLSSVKMLVSGGTKVPARLIKEYNDMGILMVQGYGSTEAWTVSVWRPDMGWDKVNSAGKPIPQVSIKIEDPDTHEELPRGEVGEVVVKSPYVFEGYYQNPSATQKVLKDGWFYMGTPANLMKTDFYILPAGIKTSLSTEATTFILTRWRRSSIKCPESSNRPSSASRMKCTGSSEGVCGEKRKLRP